MNREVHVRICEGPGLKCPGLLGGMCKSSGRVWRVPVYWPGGVRREGGASLICGYYMKRGKACADTAPIFAEKVEAGVRGSAPGSRNCEVSSTDAGTLADQPVVVTRHL